MASHTPSPFQRVVPTADLFRGRSLWSLSLSFVATLAWALLWCNVYLFVDVLVTGGELRLADFVADSTQAKPVAASFSS